MSTHSKFSPKGSDRSVSTRIGLAALCLFSFFLSAQVLAHARVEIQRIEAMAFFGNYQSIDINLAENDNPDGYSSLSFRIAYDTAFFTYKEISTGALLQSCGWEDATATEVSPGVIAVNATPGGSASCNLESATGTICRITFRVTFNTTHTYEASPVQFYWEDCADNALTSLDGNTLSLADTVRTDSFESPLPTPTSLPSLNGPTDSCLSASLGATPVQDVAFVGRYLEMQGDDALPRGDLNLNNIIDEPADREIFGNYFLMGLIVFNLSVSEQIAQTDVNGDGLVLTVADLLFMQRIIVGDTVPVPVSNPFGEQPASPEASGDTVYIYNDLIHHIVSLTTPRKLLHVGLSSAMGGMPESIDFAVPVAAYINENLGIVLSDDIAGITSGLLFTYTGDGTGFSVGLPIDFHQQTLPVKYVTISTQCADFNASGSVNILDVGYLVSYLFAGGAAPLDQSMGNVNCDGGVNILDVISLVSYYFGGGPGTACCLGE